MGTACCHFPNIQTPRPSIITPLSQPSSRYLIKFNDIAPANQLSQVDINVLQELSMCLKNYETKNGLISRRMTLQSSLPPVKIQNDALVKSFQSYLASDRQQVKLNLSQINLSSHSGDESCVLSQHSNFLTNSIFTERRRLKEIFYNTYNRIQEIELQEWDDNKRQTLELTQNQINLFNIKYPQAAKFSLILQTILRYQEQLQVCLITYCQAPCGLRVHFNGVKRLFPMKWKEKITINCIYEQVLSKIMHLDVVEIIFFLTGWIAQKIDIRQISSFQGVFERIYNSVIDGSILVTLSYNQSQVQQFFCLSSINVKDGQIQLQPIPWTQDQSSILVASQNIIVSFEDFVEKFDFINLNWNPSIYDVILTRQIKMESHQQIKFFLTIPPSSTDIQIRLLLEIHNQTCNYPSLTIDLNELQGAYFDEMQLQSIRMLHTEGRIYSDVFIFQSCKEKTKYLLTLTTNQLFKQELFANLTLFSFVEIQYKPAKTKPICNSAAINAIISQANLGYGINSPSFDKNLQFAIEVELDHEFNVQINCSQNMVYQICLIPDPQGHKNLRKVQLETIVNKFQISNQKNGKGQFCMTSTYSNYILVLTCYHPANQIIQINLTEFGKQNETGDKLAITPIQSTYSQVVLENIKWLPHHSGPRKRLKSNTNNNFHPLSTFEEFFKNPTFTINLTEGVYKFFLRNKTYQQYFQESQSKHICDPPALSIAILMFSQDGQQIKIIQDDQFYVPFGMGYWTSQLMLAAGKYKLVFPKMEKDFSKGSFGVLKI